MGTVREIEKAVSKLPRKELASFRAWFEQFDAKEWDKQYKEDVISGKLGIIVDKAIVEYKVGRADGL